MEEAAADVRAGQRAEHSVPRLSWLVPRADRLSFMQGVLHSEIKIEPVVSILVKQLAAAVPKQLVNANLEFKGRGLPLIEQRAIGLTVARVSIDKSAGYDM